MSGRRARWRDETGAELIEFAFAFPLMLLVMASIIDFGFLFQRYEVLTNAAREGARVAVLPGYTDGDVQTRVGQYLDAAGLTDAGRTATVGAAESVDVGGQCITVRPVTVTYPQGLSLVGPLTVYFGGTAFARSTITATASMRNEMPAAGCP